MNGPGTNVSTTTLVYRFISGLPLNFTNIEREAEACPFPMTVSCDLPQVILYYIILHHHS